MPTAIAGASDGLTRVTNPDYSPLNFLEIWFAFPDAGLFFIPNLHLGKHYFAYWTRQIKRSICAFVMPINGGLLNSSVALARVGGGEPEG
jgi:hypothetical protein